MPAPPPAGAVAGAAPTIGVVDPHGVVRAVPPGQREDDAITAHTEVTVAQLMATPPAPDHDTVRTQPPHQPALCYSSEARRVSVCATLALCSGVRMGSLLCLLSTRMKSLPRPWYLENDTAGTAERQEEGATEPGERNGSARTGHFVCTFLLWHFTSQDQSARVLTCSRHLQGRHPAGAEHATAQLSCCPALP